MISKECYGRTWQVAYLGLRRMMQVKSLSIQLVEWIDKLLADPRPADTSADLTEWRTPESDTRQLHAIVSSQGPLIPSRDTWTLVLPNAFKISKLRSQPPETICFLKIGQGQSFHFKRLTPFLLPWILSLRTYLDPVLNQVLCEAVKLFHRILNSICY